MFGISETELALILIFAFLIFGPDKLPGMGRTVGRAIRQFRDAQDSVTKVVQSEIVDPINSGMNEPAAKKRAEQAKAAQAEDADIEGVEGAEAVAPAKKPETFAERKARLEAERKAKESAAADEKKQAAFDENEKDEVGESFAGADSDEDLPEGEDEAPKEPDLAALYAMTPKDHKAEKAATSSEPAKADEAPASATAEAAPAASAADSGKEE